MIYSIFPEKDASIYEVSSSINTGIDEILELSKVIVNETASYNSRILIKFNLSDISASIASRQILPSARFYLNLRAISSEEINDSYTLHAFPVSQSWDNGIGRRSHDPATTTGVSWEVRSGTTLWRTSSFATGTTGSYITNPGGATWHSSSVYFATQSFNLQSPDIRMDVTNIVRKWISGSIPNEGFILKRSHADETSIIEQGRLKFYSNNTHTIYVPKLEVAWNNTSFSTGSLSALTDENIVVYMKNLQTEYKENSKVLIRTLGRPRYPARTFSTSSSYTTIKYLPTSSYYCIKDTITDEVVVPFDNTYTKLGCDSSGNYFRIWMNGLLAERHYKFILKVVRSGGNEQYFDNNFHFKISR